MVQKGLVALVKDRVAIHHTEKDGDWNISVLAHENPKTAHKNAQKSSENFKSCIHYVVSTETNFVKIWLSTCANDSITCRFARYCGKMYSRHLFPYGGL